MDQKRIINLDVNASFGIIPAVIDYLNLNHKEILNPSSVHQGGQKSRYLVEQARDLIRKSLKLPRDGTVVFTSGATESNNSCLMNPFWSYLGTNRGEKALVPELIISSVEHPAIVEPAMRLKALGVVVHIVKPRSDFNFYPEDFAELVNERTKLISVMAVNNETGCILPISKISEICKQKNPRVLMHTDAVQLYGKSKFCFDDLNVDYMSISAHKIGGLSGVGAIIVKQGYGVDSILLGGPQETRRRAGTENVLGIATFGVAVNATMEELEARISSMKSNRVKLKELISKKVECTFQFDSNDNIGNTLSVRFDGVSSADLVVALDVNGIYCSSGSACSSGKAESSKTLVGYGLSEKDAYSTIRLSLGCNYSEGDIEYAAEKIAFCVNRMRKN
jgi:cysteine desulfurase